MGSSKPIRLVKVGLLLVCFVALCVAVLSAAAAARADRPDMAGRILSTEERDEIIRRNSALTDYVYLSPNADFPREANIDRITIHMFTNMDVVEQGRLFAMRDTSSQMHMSANYAVDADGKVGLYVEEADRAWASGSPENDHRAVNIVVANGWADGDWHVPDEAMEKLIELCADICRRNGIGMLTWTGDDMGNLTMHSMFAGTECPGYYLRHSMGMIAEQVNQALWSDPGY